MSTITRRKTRADAKLARLNEQQRERLHFWLEENRTYAEVVRLLRDEFGISVGKSTVGVYYRRHLLPEQEHDEAEVVAALAALPAADFDAATLNRVKVLAWLAVARPDPDVDLFAKLMAIVGKVEREALAVRKLAVDERNVAVREKQAALREAAAQRRGVAERETALSGPEKSACEIQNPPRFPDYSGVVQVETEAKLEATKRAEEMKDETWEIEKPGKVEESTETAGRGESAEFAAKAQRSEGLSKEAEAVNFSAEVAEPAVDGMELERRAFDGLRREAA